MRKFKTTREIIDSLPSGKKERCMAMLKKIIFLDDQLEKLQKIINKKGLIEEYQNGANQKGFKKSSESTVYEGFIKQYNACVRQLENMIGPNKETGAGNKLMDFIAKGKGLSMYEEYEEEETEDDNED